MSSTEYIVTKLLEGQDESQQEITQSFLKIQEHNRQKHLCRERIEQCAQSQKQTLYELQKLRMKESQLIRTIETSKSSLEKEGNYKTQTELADVSKNIADLEKQLKKLKIEDEALTATIAQHEKIIVAYTKRRNSQYEVDLRKIAYCPAQQSHIERRIQELHRYEDYYEKELVEDQNTIELMKETFSQMCPNKSTTTLKNNSKLNKHPLSRSFAALMLARGESVNNESGYKKSENKDNSSIMALGPKGVAADPTPEYSAAKANYEITHLGQETEHGERLIAIKKALLAYHLNMRNGYESLQKRSMKRDSKSSSQNRTPSK